MTRYIEGTGLSRRRPSAGRGARLAATAFALLLIAGVAGAGDFSAHGVVRDTAGNAVAGADVVLTTPDGVVDTAISDAQGQYQVAASDGSSGAAAQLEAHAQGGSSGPVAIWDQDMSEDLVIALP